jgi:molecular chaperone GrpE
MSRPPRSDDFQIEIDPSLIEEALASVARHSTKSDAPSTGDVAVDVELELDVPMAESPVPPAEPVEQAARAEIERYEDERRRLHFRVSEQGERVRRLEADLARVTESRDGLERQLRDLRKGHSELSADFDRYRIRARKDAEEAERRGEDRSLRPIIDVYDNVERAWLHAVSDPSQILGGLQIIVEQFKRLLVRLGFERIDADRGTLFDPAWHEAVLHVPSDELLPGVIVDEVHAGFKLRGRLFRAARVTVSASIAPL